MFPKYRVLVTVGTLCRGVWCFEFRTLDARVQQSKRSWKVGNFAPVTTYYELLCLALSWRYSFLYFSPSRVSVGGWRVVVSRSALHRGSKSASGGFLSDNAFNP
jgi:hypothetical protein